MEDSADPKQRKRGHYLSYLSHPSVKVPKTTSYRNAKQDARQETRTTTLNSGGCGDEIQAVEEDQAGNVSVAEVCDAALTETDVSTDDYETFHNRCLEQPSDPVQNQQSCDQTAAFNSSSETCHQDAITSALLQERLVEDPALAYADINDCQVFTDPDETFADDIWENQDVDDFFEGDCATNFNGEDIDSSSAGDGEEKTEKSSVPLFYGARISIAVSMLLIITYAVRHSLTGVALADLLLLIDIHLICPNNFGNSMAILRKFFQKLKNPVEFHYYCSFCNEYIGTTKSQYCSNKHCLKDFGKKGTLDYFIVLPLVTQLQAFLTREEVPDLIQHPMKRTKKNTGNIEDIYDGRLYKKHFTLDGYFKGTDSTAKQCEVHLSLQINTDGVALFRSSKYSIWPLYFLVNELPPKCRQQRKYRMFAGLWFGVKKPHFQTFLQPFAIELKSLFTRGAPVTINKKEKILRCIVIFGTFDAPAKCLFQEFCQFNAFYGCPYCLNPGITVKTSAKGHTHAYPFDETNLRTGHGADRSHQQTLEFAAAATKKTVEKCVQSDVKGVKGFSWFMFVPKFDIIRSVAIDYMHGALLGVVKMLLTLWLDTSYSKKPWSVRKRIGEIESRYMRIMPPCCITRPPRSLIGNFGHLKASELRSFLLFYSIPCLYGILPEEHFQHYILLVEAIYLLLQESISIDDLVKSSALLKHFCLKIKVLYEARYETFNAHCLLHLTERVCDLGPLWAQSCFCYEDFNGELRRLFHGTQSVESQIVLAISIQQKIPELVPLLPEGSESKELYLKLSHGGNARYKKQKIGENCFAVGTIKKVVLSAGERAVVETLIGPVSKVYQFQRLVTGDQLVHCQLYKSMTKRNNFTVQYEARPLGTMCYGQVKFYVKCQLACPNPQFCSPECVCAEPHYLAVISKLESNADLLLANDKHTGAKLAHIIPVFKQDNSLTAIAVEQIIRICVYIDCGNRDNAYIGMFPNQYEKD